MQRNAERLDAYFTEHGKLVGPLHDLSVSLKDQFHVKWVETMMGYVGWIGTFQGRKDDLRRATFESELVKELRSLGATLYCKPTVPARLLDVRRDCKPHHLLYLESSKQTSIQWRYLRWRRRTDSLEGVTW
jgi:Asp-tRNA(Asn)/Glu-tRNA(Gln) amidotransferase A subunit family amidase